MAGITEIHEGGVPHRTDYLLNQVGELRGTTQAMNQSLVSLSDSLSRLRTDVFTHHNEHLRIIQEHNKEDDRRFDKVNRILYSLVGAVGFVEFLSRFVKFSKGE